MKNFVSGVLATLIFLAILSFQGDKHENNYPKKEWIIESKYLHLQKGVNKQEAREWLEKNYLPIYREYPGFNAILGEHTGGAIWGEQFSVDKSKGDFVIFYIFDTKQTKDFYFPKDGPWNELVQNAMKKYQPTVDDFFGKYIDKKKYYMNEYTIYASAK
jgi:hypothetical protein